MPTDPTITRILESTPLHTEVSVSKVFDLAEEVELALERTGHTAEWLAEKAGMTLDELLTLLSGMDSFYDPIARLEAAFEQDLFVGATQGGRYFSEDKSFENVPSKAVVTPLYKHRVVIAYQSTVNDNLDNFIWQSGAYNNQHTVGASGYSSHTRDKSYKNIFANSQ